MVYRYESTTRDYAWPVGVNGIAKFDDLTKEDCDLPTFLDQLNAGGRA